MTEKKNCGSVFHWLEQEQSHKNCTNVVTEQCRHWFDALPQSDTSLQSVSWRDYASPGVFATEQTSVSLTTWDSWLVSRPVLQTSAPTLKETTQQCSVGSSELAQSCGLKHTVSVDDDSAVPVVDVGHCCHGSLRLVLQLLHCLTHLPDSSLCFVFRVWDQTLHPAARGTFGHLWRQKLTSTANPKKSLLTLFRLILQIDEYFLWQDQKCKEF